MANVQKNKNSLQILQIYKYKFYFWLLFCCLIFFLFGRAGSFLQEEELVVDGPVPVEADRSRPVGPGQLGEGQRQRGVLQPYEPLRHRPVQALGPHGDRPEQTILFFIFFDVWMLFIFFS